jgi:hypothetical protein
MNRVLERLLFQYENRLTAFAGLIFTPDQCRILAVSGTKTKIRFTMSVFQDGGVVFVEGPAILTFSCALPFDERNFILFLNQQRNLECLSLYDICLESEEACRALAEADVQYLDLEGCSLADGGAALVGSVRDGGFRVRGDDGNDGDDDDEWVSPEWCISFLNALGGNSYIERLDLSNIHFRDGIPQALASALRENEGLTHLSLCYCRLNDNCWSELIGAIPVRPSLCNLAFEWIQGVIQAEDDLPSPSVKRDRTRALAGMLLVNTRVDEIPLMTIRSIRLSGMHSLFRDLSAISTGSDLFHCKRSGNRLPALPLWQEPWLVWQRNRILFGCSCYKTKTFFSITWTRLSVGQLSLGSGAILYSLAFRV